MRKLPKADQERLRRIRFQENLRSKRELRLTPGFQTHEHLLSVVKKLPTDFEPWGKREPGTGGDCSCGCRWFHVLKGSLESDWGICANPKSPRVGLLTFEHQGCPQFEHDKRWDYLRTAAGKKAAERFIRAERERKVIEESKSSDAD
jgi:hypothetical protein